MFVPETIGPDFRWILGGCDATFWGVDVYRVLPIREGGEGDLRKLTVQQSRTPWRAQQDARRRNSFPAQAPNPRRSMRRLLFRRKTRAS